jgi:hypothetical protein
MNVVNIEEKLDSKRIKNEYEAVLKIFSDSRNHIITKMFPFFDNTTIFPYDKDLTDKLSLTDGKLDSADIIRALYLGNFYQFNLKILNLVGASTYHLEDNIDVNISGNLLRSGFEYYSMYYYSSAKIDIHLKKENWIEIFKILLKISFSKSSVLKNKIITTSVEDYFNQIFNDVVKKDNEPIKVTETLQYLEKKIDWEIDGKNYNELKNEFKREYYSYLSQITHPVGIQSSIPDRITIWKIYEEKKINTLKDFFEKISIDSEKLLTFNSTDNKIYEYIKYFYKTLACLNFLLAVNSKFIRNFSKLKKLDKIQLQNINKTINDYVGYEVVLKKKYYVT